MNGIKLTFSNRIEALFEGLKRYLYEKRRSPFEKIVIIVPSPAMKSYIMRSLAEAPELQIAFGFQVMYLDSAIDWLTDKLQGCKGKIPSEFELALQIDQECERIAMEGGEGAEVIARMGRYLEFGKNGAEKSAIGYRRAALAQEIAKLFLLQGEFSSQEARRFDSESPKGWRERLWQKIFPLKGKALPLYRFIEEFQPKEAPYPIQVHFFGLSFISAEKFNFFQKIAPLAVVRGWILSPCRMYSSDMKTERQARNFVKKLEAEGKGEEELAAFEEYYLEGHPLLSANGKLHRNWMRELDELILESEEGYFVAEEVSDHPHYQDLLFDEVAEVENEPLTLLRALQSDITLLRPLKEGAIDFPKSDDSIQIHSSVSPQREVEALYQTLTHLFKTHPHLEPKDVIIMTPSLQEYAPWMRAIFEREGSHFSIEIDDLTILQESPFIASWFKLLDLADSRWEFEHFFEVIENPQFLHKAALSMEDIREVRRIFEDTSVCFGKTLAHREEVLAQGKLAERSERGTWRFAIDTLVRKMTGYQFDDTAYSRGSPISLLQGEILGRFAKILHSLESALAPLEKAQIKTALEWGECFEALIDEFYEDPFDSKEQDAAQELHHIIRKLKKQQGIALPFSAIREHLRSELTRVSSSHKEKNLQAIRLSGALPMRAVPSKVIVWLGLNEATLPSPSTKSPLQGSAISYIPSKGDFDRSLFLESLLSTREHFILSYTEAPSLLIAELLETLDKSFEIGDQKPSQALLRNHPLFGFDPKYFHTSSEIPSYSESDYEVLKKWQMRGQRKAAPPFLPPHHIETLSLEKLPRHIHLNLLKRFSNHPLKYFYQQVLGVYLGNKSLQSELTPEFEEDDYLFYRLFPLVLTSSPEEVLMRAQKEHLFPVAPFQAVSMERMRLRMEEQLSSLKEMGIDPKEVFEVRFSYGENLSSLPLQKNVTLPALTKSLHGKKVTITGTLPYVCPQGVIFFREHGFENMVKLLPEILLAEEIPEGIASKKLIFTTKKKTFPIGEGFCFESYIEAFLRGSHQPLPFMPSWVKPIIEQDKISLKKAMDASILGPYKGESDPYLEWGLGTSMREVEGWQTKWQSAAEKLFSPLLKMLEKKASVES